jgi:hypothetical protein
VGDVESHCGLPQGSIATSRRTSLKSAVAVTIRVAANDAVDLEIHLAHHAIKRMIPTWRVTVDEIWSAVPRGYTHDGRLIGRGARDQEPDGNRDIRHKIYTGSDHQYDVKPYILCSVILY